MDLRLKILNFVMPISKWIAKIHAPFTHKEVNGQHFFSILPYLKPGAVFLSYKRGELANGFIPGEFSHAAIYGCTNIVNINGKSLDIHYVVEATMGGVVMTDLISFMTSKDRVCLLYPNFCDDEDMVKALGYAGRCIGYPYDFLFDPGDKAFFCSELIQKAYDYSIPGCSFTTRKRFGVETVIPDDFYKSAKSENPKWDIVFDTKSFIKTVALI